MPDEPQPPAARTLLEKAIERNHRAAALPNPLKMPPKSDAPGTTPTPDAPQPQENA